MATTDKKRAKCRVCMSLLRVEDNACPYACDPALARPRARAKSLDSKLRQREGAAAPAINLPIGDVIAAAERVDATYRAIRRVQGKHWGRLDFRRKSG